MADRDLKPADFEAVDAVLDKVRETLVRELEVLEEKFGTDAAQAAGEWIATVLFVEGCRTGETTLSEAHEQLDGAWTALATVDGEPSPEVH